MRVTNQMMAASMLGNLNQLRSRQASLSDQISSGDRITKASEDPMAGLDVMRIQSKSNALKQWQSNLVEAKSWINATESKLGDITDILNSAKELALTASNGTISDETRKSLAPGAEQMLSDMMAALNEKEPSGYLFGGFQTDGSAPFAVDPVGTVTYNGDGNVMQRDVGPGVTLSTNIPGSRLLNPSDPNNMLKALWDLKTALKTPVVQSGKTDLNGDGVTDVDTNNDLYIDEDLNGDGVIDTPTNNSKLMPQTDASLQDRIKDVVAKLDSARQTVVALRAEMGARQMRVEQLETRHQDMQVQLEDGLQQAQGVDATKAIIDLNNAETTYRAALQVGGRIIPQTLADFLR
jgi:flagellar hook-associated protein 3 FlgL